MATGWPHPRWVALPLGGLSLTANYGILWYVISVLPWSLGEPRPLARALYVAVPVTLVEAAGFLIKHFVARPRPPVADPSQPRQIPLPFSKSFPSSHASMAVVGTFTVGSPVPVRAAGPHRRSPSSSASAACISASTTSATCSAGSAFGLVVGAVWVLLVPAPL